MAPPKPLALMRPALVLLALILLPMAQGLPVFEDEPQARFHDAEVWHAQALVAGFDYTRTGCSPAGSAWMVAHWLNGQEPDQIYWPGEEECLTLTTRAPPAAYAVGTLGACSMVEDSAGRSGIDDGHVTLALFPSDPASVVGFPRFDMHDATFDVEVYAEFILAPDGDVRGYRWGTDGRVHGDTLIDTPIQADDRWVTIEVERPLSEAHVRVDGELAWQGMIRQSGAKWWQFAPVGDTGAAAGLLHYRYGLCV